MKQFVALLKKSLSFKSSRSIEGNKSVSEDEKYFAIETWENSWTIINLHMTNEYFDGYFC